MKVKLAQFLQTRLTSLRLALTHLAIIMVLSASFSLVFYRTSVANFEITLPQLSNAPKVTQNTDRIIASPISNDLTLPQSADLVYINAQLRQHTHQIRLNLLRHLILLNLSALILGAALSYYLARRSLRPIEAAMDTQARFSSDASHELRTPLTALRVRNEVALRNTNLTLAEAKAVMGTSIEQVIKLEGLSEGLLRLSRNDRTSTARQPVRLGDLASEAVQQVFALAQAKRTTIDNAVPRLVVLADADSVTQVIVILLENAIKYSKHGSAISITGASEGKYGLLHIKDHGTGIRATDLPHIFERFYRADYSRTKEGDQGYGLGLSIAKKLVEHNGGKITVRSVVGRGSTFTLSLPLVKF